MYSAQTGVNISNTQSAAYSLYEEYKQTGSVSWQNVGSFMMSSVAAVAGTKATIGNAKSLKAVGTQKITPVAEWGCFIAGTPVKTEDGQKNIEEIKAGERVYAKNTETGEEGYKEVVRVFVKDVNKLVHLQIGETKIDTTTNHPFWVVGYGFKEAGDLGTGEKVLTATGEIKTITGVEVEELETPVTVYNFEVKDWHTYYVSELEVLVHNKCEVAGTTKSAGGKASDGYQFKDGIDVDMRGKGSVDDALEEAFKRVQEPKENFYVTKWAEIKNEYGKSVPVEWTSTKHKHKLVLTQRT